MNITNCDMSHDFEYVNCKDGETTWRCRRCPESTIEYTDCTGG